MEARPGSKRLRLLKRRGEIGYYELALEMNVHPITAKYYAKMASKADKNILASANIIVYTGGDQEPQG